MESRKRTNYHEENKDDKKHRKRSRFDQGPLEEGGDQSSTDKNFIDPALAAREAAEKLSASIPLGTAASAINTSVGESSGAYPFEQLQQNSLRTELMRKSIQEQLNSIKSHLAKAKDGTKKHSSFVPAPLLLDEHGRQIDASGKIIHEAIAPVATLKANKPSISNSISNPYLAHRVEDPADKVDILDPRLKLKKREIRATKGLSFVKEGTFVKQGEQMRDREARKMMAGFTSGRNPRSRNNAGIVEIEETKEDQKNDTEDKCRRLLYKVEVPMVEKCKTPIVEWWDAEYLSKEDKDHLDKFGFFKAKSVEENGNLEINYTQMKLKNSATWHVIEHTARIKLHTKKEEPVAIPLMLTAIERKKIRRQNRAEREKEKQDKVALGLMPPPEPKVKLSNMMRVLQEQAVADPSAIEKKVREQVAQRQMNHEMRNLARKLTPEERREKKRFKLKEDAAGDIHVAVFCVLDLSSPKNRFKLDVNAQQSMLSGGVLMCKEEPVNLVVVEGGEKSISKYVKLMTRRINWKGDREEEHSDGESDHERQDDSFLLSEKKCSLIWRGTVAKKSFNSFRFQECRTSITARKVMEAKHVAHYWDMVYKAYQAIETK